MKKIYLFFILFAFYAISAQHIKEVGAESITKDVIIKKLKYIKENGDSIDSKQQESMLLQLKEASEKLKFENGVLLSGDYLMSAYGMQDKNKEIVELGNELKKIVQNKHEDPTGVMSSIYRKNALALMYLGLDSASKKDVETAIRLAKTIKNSDRKYLRLTQSYMDLHSYYNSMNHQFQKKRYKDSTVYYLNKALEVGLKIKDDNGEISNQIKYNEVIFIYTRLGIFYLEYSDEKGNLELSEKNLLKAEKLQEKTNALPIRSQTTLLNQLSWLYLEKKEYRKSIDYANRSLQLEKHHERPSSRVESYEFLATCYMEIGEKEKSKYYMRKYTNLKDSITIAGRTNADTTIKKMVAEVDKGHQENSKKQLILTGVLVLIAIIVSIMLWRRKKRIIHKKYEELIAKINEDAKEVKETEVLPYIKNNESKSSIVITDETVKALLSKLEKFEKSEKYLRKDLSLTWMSNNLNTNPKYLSEVIKIYRENSFTSYINELRINYIIRKLYENPIYREYKITYLAEECGYTTPKVFVNAFKKETGFTPSYFVEQLKVSA
ncbi:helix-turn-helix domain-containing protein [Chryseobacterium jejuense]|uniref:DNA-binding transcriptional regulator ChbR n=1 Tax=Chryseobacterium jejuense TaxID=445960 RepID=A0A2X2XNE2_CHRJE|nr:helix-turn-helix domain-containing protein [Chryseobacterium jejuense]SDJ11546.1 Helix-turn-helix domain-containing protein [Chryseobacterium jejuense]SQB27930.1 DNA-binding transcriptional regulator ChbR [Chryseobacterium jejuense]